MSWQSRSKTSSPRRKFSFHRSAVVRENSYLREPTPTQATKPSHPSTWLLLALPFLIIGLFYYVSGLTITGLATSPVKNINPQDIQELFDSQRKQTSLLFLDQSNLLLFNNSQFKQKLLSTYQFHNLEVKKNFHKRQIELQFQEKDYDLVWEEGETYYYINYAGDIILTRSKNSTSTLGNLLSLLNTGTPKKQDRRINLDEKYLRTASALNEALNHQARGLSSRRLAIGSEYNTIQVLMLNGPIIYFDINSDLQTQLAKLEALRKNNLADGRLFNQQKYIDLRYGKSIFYQ